MLTRNEPASNGLESIIQSYLKSFESKDVTGCVDFFAEDGLIHFQTGTFRGKESIERWHADRFEADAKIENVESMRINGDTVVIDAAVSSKQLAAWRIRSVRGRLTVRFQNGKIKEFELSR